MIRRTALYLVYWQSVPISFNKCTVINFVLNSFNIVQLIFLHVKFLNQDMVTVITNFASREFQMYS
jgi:hypothetical protein